MNRNPTAAIALAGLAALALGGGFGQSGYRPRVLTLEEEEERSVQRMVNRARARRRQTERERRRAEEAEQARIAAEKEAARPKSRQEIRARERAILKHTGREMPPTKFGRVVAKDKSDSLKRMLRKRR